jgi:hypothetical protein
VTENNTPAVSGRGWMPPSEGDGVVGTSEAHLRVSRGPLCLQTPGEVSN